MDALSTPVSTLRPRCFLSTNPREPHLLRPPSTANTTHIPPPYPHLLNKPRATSTKPLSSFTAKPFQYSSSLSPSRSPSYPKPKPLVTHQKASTGYAAALLDVAQCDNAVDAVEKDVRRFMWRVHPAVTMDPLLEDEEKGEVVKRVAEEGGFCKQLVALVKMLVVKRKVGVVGEVMEEFQRIYDELSGTRVVLVSSEERLGKEQLAGIAKKVQGMSGAVKVKVRQMYRGSSPTFAM